MIRSFASIRVAGRRSPGPTFLLLLALLIFPLLGGVAVVKTIPHAFATSSTVSSPGDTLVAPSSPSRVYVMSGDHINVLDAQTGQVVHQLPLRLATQSFFIAAHPATNRVFITDAVFQGNKAIDYLTVYRTTDWSIERQVPVPDIIRYFGEYSGIAPSDDGKYLYVYNYNDRTRGTSPVRYWLSALDLSTGNWLPQQVDLPGCGASQLLVNGSAQVDVLCYDSNDVRTVNTATFAIAQTTSVVIAQQQRSAGRLPKVATATLRNGTLYVVGENREVHALSQASTDRMLTAAADTDRVVPFQPVALDADGSNLYVPSGSADERSRGLASDITVINVTSGAVVRILHPSRPYRWVTFSSDGTTAFLGLVGDDGKFATSLVRLDLQTGKETQLLQGPVGSGLIVSP